MIWHYGLLFAALGTDVVGNWSGSVQVEGDVVELRLVIPDALDDARFTAPDFGWYDLPARVAPDADGADVTLSVYRHSAELDLTLDDGVLTGRWSGWGAEGTVTLKRTGDALPPYVAEPVALANGDTHLEGTLLVPRGPGPFAAVVWTHGSGRVTRENPIYRSLAVWFVERGIASLIYDKRPPKMTDTVEDLARDALAGVAQLEGDERLGPIGVGGMSQGGWISPAAAALSEDVAFVVGLSAPGVSPAEQNVFNQRNRVLNAGFSEDEAAEATRILRAVYDYLRSGEGEDAVVERLAWSRSEAWGEAAFELRQWEREGLPDAPWPPVSELDFDPPGAWSRIRVPVACIWGADDTAVPAHLSRDLVRTALDAAGHHARQLAVLPGADHDLRLPAAPPWSLGKMHPAVDDAPRFVRSLARPASFPPTERRAHEEVVHGVRITDPYRWLERPSKETDAWVRAQDERTKTRFDDDPLRRALRERLTELYQYARAPVPRRGGDLYFTEGQIPGQNLSEVCAADSPGGEPRVLVDPHRHPASPGVEVALSEPRPSPDGKYVAYGAYSSLVPDSVRLLDVETGEDLPGEALPIRYWPWLVSWLPDSSGLVYADGTTVRLHHLGTSATDDPVIYRDGAGTTMALAVRASDDGRAVFVTAFDSTADETRVFLHELGVDTGTPQAVWRELTAGARGDYRVVGLRDSRVFLYTTVDAPRGRIVSFPLDRTEKTHWTTVAPEAAEVVWDDFYPQRPAAGIFGDRLAVLYGRTDGRMVVRTFALDGEPLDEFAHPTIGFTESGLFGRGDESVVRYDVQTMVDPGTAFELDLETGRLSAIGRATTPFDPADYELGYTSFESFDGAEVSLFIAHRKGLVRDGSHAVALNHRGSGELMARPLYLPPYHAWIERGGVFALPYRARGTREQLAAAKDMIAAAEWLVANDYTQPHKIGLMGMSAGGPVAACALLTSPDSFGAGVLRISHLDMLRHSASREMFGDPDDPTDFGTLLEWSPYRLVRPRAYPPTFVQAGSNDTVAPPFHGYKFVAALQHAQRGPGPIHLQVVWNAGHSQGRGIEWISDTWSVELTFLARELGLHGLR